MTYTSASPGGSADGLQDAAVAIATAQVTGKDPADFFVLRGWVGVQQGTGRNQESGCAVSALGSVLVEERLLHRIEASVGCQPPTVRTLRLIALPTGMMQA